MPLATLHIYLYGPSTNELKLMGRYMVFNMVSEWVPIPSFFSSPRGMSVHEICWTSTWGGVLVTSSPTSHIAWVMPLERLHIYTCLGLSPMSLTLWVGTWFLTAPFMGMGLLWKSLTRIDICKSSSPLHSQTWALDPLNLHQIMALIQTIQRDNTALNRVKLKWKWEMPMQQKKKRTLWEKRWNALIKENNSISFWIMLSCGSHLLIRWTINQTDLGVHPAQLTLQNYNDLKNWIRNRMLLNGRTKFVKMKCPTLIRTFHNLLNRLNLPLAL